LCRYIRRYSLLHQGKEEEKLNKAASAQSL